MQNEANITKFFLSSHEHEWDISFLGKYKLKKDFPENSNQNCMPSTEIVFHMYGL